MMSKEYITLLIKFLEAAEQAGHSIGESTAEDPIKFDAALMTIFDGVRVSSQTAYLDPIVAKRLNLDILCFARVENVLFVGVQYQRDGVLSTVRASKEIVLSTLVCPLSSPKILLSGIGPRQDLEKLDIEVISDFSAHALDARNLFYMSVETINHDFVKPEARDMMASIVWLTTVEDG